MNHISNMYVFLSLDLTTNIKFCTVSHQGVYSKLLNKITDIHTLKQLFTDI
jgi:hypothetical protein